MPGDLETGVEHVKMTLTRADLTQLRTGVEGHLPQLERMIVTEVVEVMMTHQGIEVSEEVSETEMTAEGAVVSEAVVTDVTAMTGMAGEAVVLNPLGETDLVSILLHELNLWRKRNRRRSEEVAKKEKVAEVINLRLIEALVADLEIEMTAEEEEAAVSEEVVVVVTGVTAMTGMAGGRGGTVRNPQGERDHALTWLHDPKPRKKLNQDKKVRVPRRAYLDQQSQLTPLRGRRKSRRRLVR